MKTYKYKGFEIIVMKITIHYGDKFIGKDKSIVIKSPIGAFLHCEDENDYPKTIKQAKELINKLIIK